MAYLLGQYPLQEGRDGAGAPGLTQVTPESRYFPKAKFLQGIAYVRLEQPKPAVEAFKDLLRSRRAATIPAKT
jgi:hypothetical protein